jgi:DNA helicase-2/ATP-dependent DNA helicase PcrA
VDQLEEKAAQSQKSLYQAIHEAINDRTFNAGTTGKLRRFLELIDDFTVQQGQFKLSEFYSIVLEKTEYIQVLKKEDTPEAEARISNLEELDNAIAQFENERGDEATLSNYLEELTLASDLDNADTETNAITLMTIHISKGLEFPFVFIVGCEENLFPSIRGDEENPDDLEEERRLAYVAMTRARKKLWMTHTKIRRVWGQEQMNPPSRFLREIPKQFTEFTSGALMPDRPRFMQGSYNNSGYSGDYSGSFKNRDTDDYNQTSYDDDYSQVTPQVSKGSGYSKGQRVRHPTFGVGSIFSTEGSGDTLKISVLFQDNTIKKFVAKYARLEKV